MVYIWKSKDSLQELVFFYYVSSRYETQVTTPGLVAGTFTG